MDLYDGEIKKLTSMLENHGAKRLPLQKEWEMTEKWKQSGSECYCIYTG